MSPISTIDRARRRERRLFHERDSDPRARDELIEGKLRLASSLAHRYAGNRSDDEDLRQVAAVGLIKAVDRYNPSLGVAFSSFAVPTITGEIRRHLRETGWAAHVSRDLQEAALAVRRARDELTPALGRSPSAAEVAELIGCSRERVVAGRAAGRALEAESLDARVPGSEVNRYEQMGAYDDHLESADSRQTVLAVLARLTDAQRELLHMRYREALTQSEIGERLGISQMHVSRLLKRALDRAAILAAE